MYSKIFKNETEVINTVLYGFSEKYVNEWWKNHHSYFTTLLITNLVLPFFFGGVSSWMSYSLTKLLWHLVIPVGFFILARWLNSRHQRKQWKVNKIWNDLNKVGISVSLSWILDLLRLCICTKSVDGLSPPPPTVLIVI